MQMKKYQKGVTLIALAVMVIVILILILILCFICAAVLAVIVEAIYEETGRLEALYNILRHIL